MRSHICFRARLRGQTLNNGPNSAPLFSSRTKETLIGQKSIKVGLLELKLRMCLSLPPIMLGFRGKPLFGRLTRAPAEMNEFPIFVVTEEGKKAW